MKNRKPKIEELLEGMSSMRRNMPFRSIGSSKMPRITPSQWNVVMLIGQRDRVSMKEAADALHMTGSAVTQLVDGLVENGYVKREESAEDRRTVMLVLSKKTKNRVAKMKENMVKRFLEVFEVLTDAEFDQFCALQKKISQRFSSKKS